MFKGVKDLRKNEETSNAGNKWLSEEDDKLVKEITNKKTFEEIAFEHKRTIGGIKSRVISQILYPKYKNDNIGLDELSSEYKIEKELVEKYINKIETNNAIKKSVAQNNSDNKKETIESKYDVNGKLVSKIQKIFSVDGGLLSITSYNVNRSVVHIETNGSVLTGTWSFSKSPEYNNNDTIVSKVAGFSDAHGKNITFIKKSVLSPNNSRIEVRMKKDNNYKWYVFGMGSHVEVF